MHKFFDIKIEDKIGIWDFNVRSKRVSWNTVMYRLHDTSTQAFNDSFVAWVSMIHPDDRESFESAFFNFSDTCRSSEFEFRLALPIELTRRLKLISHITYDQFAKPERITGICFDLDDHEAIESKCSTMYTVVEQNPLSIMITDANTIIKYVNPSFSKLTGYSSNELLGKKPTLLKSGQTPKQTYQQMWSALLKGATWSGQLVNRKKNGAIYYEKVHMAPIKNKAGLITHFVSIKLDITKEKKNHEQLTSMAHYDSLTGLCNRLFFFEKLQYAITVAKREKEKIALLFLDLDKFKPINDSYGHAMGDKVLREIALRLKSITRESDCVGRIGGDEFVIFLPKIQSTQQVLTICEKIKCRLSEPILIHNNPISIACCIGIALYPDHGNSINSLSQNADSAMYEAKAIGGNTITMFNNRIIISP
jgi:diguanylate cyclase (GGDEF)-like protein/PAS domain S-box-containing protein